jgi:hypothetical protein
MRASLRWKNFMLGGLLLVPSAAIAQSASDPAPSSPPATDAVGPQELQNFSLSGSVTKTADPQPEAAPTATSPATRGSSVRDSAAPSTGQTERKVIPREAGQKRATVAPATVAADKPAAEASSGFMRAQSVPPFANPAPPSAATSSLGASSFPASPVPVPASNLGTEHGLLIWPWLVAALAGVGATFFLFWRRRQQSAFAGVPEFDLFTAPEPVPAPPAPSPAPPRAPTPPRALEPKAPTPAKKPVRSGIVSTRLRPSLEVEVRPLRCLVEEGRVVVEFELELFNAGTAPARAVLAEASLFNAGANQEQELAVFFANPVGAGERLDVIPPMQRITFRNQVVAPREAIQEYELGGRKVFVPVLAFNALYAWSAGEAQTSAAFLVGRDTAGEKLGPLSLDRGPRQIGKLAARLLPTAMRT